jgi:hypothetical protein
MTDACTDVKVLKSLPSPIFFFFFLFFFFFNLDFPRLHLSGVVGKLQQREESGCSISGGCDVNLLMQ